MSGWEPRIQNNVTELEKWSFTGEFGTYRRLRWLILLFFLLSSDIKTI